MHLLLCRKAGFNSVPTSNPFVPHRGPRAAYEPTVSCILNAPDGRMVKWIVTPGFGDTRGGAQDSVNLENIITTFQREDDMNALLLCVSIASRQLQNYAGKAGTTLRIGLLMT